MSTRLIIPYIYKLNSLKHHPNRYDNTYNVVPYTILVDIPRQAHNRLGKYSQYSRCTIHCGENFRIFRDAADQTLPVTENSEIDN
jgi:hypothetical protein